MSSDIIFQLQKAIYGLLRADVTLTGLITGIYEYVPQRTAFPYLVLNEITAANWSTKTSNGAACNVSLKAYCRDMQDSVLLQIISLASDDVRSANLTLTGHRITSITFQDMDMKRMSDGITYMATAKFKILSEET